MALGNFVQRTIFHQGLGTSKLGVAPKVGEKGVALKVGEKAASNLSPLHAPGFKGGQCPEVEGGRR